MNKLKINRKDLIPIIFEYLILVLPIGIYVMLEALHKHKWTYFFQSPEWGIATIFLSFQGVSIYIKSLSGKNKQLNHSFLGILILIVIVVTIAAILNSYLSLENDSNTYSSIVFRLLLFLISTLYFFILTLSGKHNENYEK